MKSLALMQHLQLPYFQVDEFYYQGEESEVKEAYNNSFFANVDFSNFPEYCAENCLLVEEDYTDIDDDYNVYTNEEANEAVKDCIEETLWAFNAEFICGYGSPLIPMVRAYQEKECENANDAIRELITDLDDFVQRAISADGRGHFLSSYDGCENEETVNGETYYIYRN